MKLLIDMNLSPKWAGFLAAAGHDAVHWSSVGEQVLVALRQLANELEIGALVTIEPERTRLRILPLQTG